MSDYDAGYKQGLEDGHRCEMRHARLHELERQVETQQAEIRDMRKSLDTAAKGIVRLTTERDALRSQVADLTAKLAAVEHQLRLRESDCAEHMADLTKVQMERNHDKSIVCAATLARQQADDLTRRLEEAQREHVDWLKKMETTLAGHLVERDALQAKLAAVEQRNKELEARLNEANKIA
jgi:chromosome segregation ATPase